MGEERSFSTALGRIDPDGVVDDDRVRIGPGHDWIPGAERMVRRRHGDQDQEQQSDFVSMHREILCQGSGLFNSPAHSAAGHTPGRPATFLFRRSLRLPGITAAQLYRFHLDTENFRDLVMPTTKVVAPPSPNVAAGVEFTIEMREFGLWPIRWPAVWKVVSPEWRLVDDLLEPVFPFARWRHEHRFEDTADGALMTDSIWIAPLLPRPARFLAPLVAPGLRAYLALMFVRHHRVASRRIC